MLLTKTKNAFMLDTYKFTKLEESHLLNIGGIKNTT